MRAAVDTNILVRLLIDDGSAEMEKVVRFVRQNRIVIAPTVLLETEWVLRYTMRLGRSQIADAFQRLLGLGNVTLLQRDSIIAALAAFRGGCDFADALHIACAMPSEVFVTLDKKFARRATSLGLVPEVLLIA